MAVDLYDLYGPSALIFLERFLNFWWVSIKTFIVFNYLKTSVIFTPRLELTILNLESLAIFYLSELLISRTYTQNGAVVAAHPGHTYYGRKYSRQVL